MAGTHNFKVFDSANSNMTTDTDYSTDTARLNGVSNGVADPLSFNKAVHQSTIMSAAIAKVLADSNVSCDDTNLANLANALKSIHVNKLTCTTTDTVHALTGLSATSGIVSCMFQTDAAYTTGDTITIDGTAYTLATTDGTTLTDGAWAILSIVPAIADINNHVLYVNPSAPVGSLPKAKKVIAITSDTTLTPDQSGAHIIANGNNITITLPSASTYAQYSIHAGTGQSYIVTSQDTIVDTTTDISGTEITMAGDHEISLTPFGSIWVVESSNDAHRAMYAFASTDLTTPRLRNVYFLNQDVPPTEIAPAGTIIGLW